MSIKVYIYDIVFQTAGTATVSATDGTNSNAAGSQFTYDAGSTPTISSLSPDSAGLVQANLRIYKIVDYII